MSKSLTPFICIGVGLYALNTLSGNVTQTPINYETVSSPALQPYNPIGDIVSPAAQAIQPHLEQYRADTDRANAELVDLQYNIARITNEMLLDAEQQRYQPTTVSPYTSNYNNGYTDSGHQYTVLGDMIHQMAHEGQIRQSTLNQANDILDRCAVIPPEHQPPACKN